MAVLKVEATFNLEPLRILAKQFPFLGVKFLSLVGKRGRTALKEELLSGQEITLRTFPKDKANRRTLVSDVSRKRKNVKIYSYPVNLFEKGRMLRSGVKEAGKFIITRKLKGMISSRMGTYVSQFENKILNPEIKKAGA